MLHANSQFPHSGSIALFLGLRWRIHQVMADGIALITREGTGACLSRRAPVAELVDPKVADENAIIALTDVSAATARIAIFVTSLLRDTNEVALRDLGRTLTEHAREGRVPLYTDNSHLVRIMRKLGWRKDGYTGEGFERSPRYVRVATANKAA